MLFVTTSRISLGNKMLLVSYSTRGNILNLTIGVPWPGSQNPTRHLSSKSSVAWMPGKLSLFCLFFFTNQTLPNCLASWGKVSLLSGVTRRKGSGGSADLTSGASQLPGSIRPVQTPQVGRNDPASRLSHPPGVPHAGGSC